MQRPDIKKLKMLCENATHTPWLITDEGIGAFNKDENYIDKSICDIWSGTKDAEFIAESRQAVPKLIKHIEQLEKEIEMFRQDTIESTNKTKLRNVELDLITDKVKELIDRNEVLVQALNYIIDYQKRSYRHCSCGCQEFIDARDIAKFALGSDVNND
jgi:hypothetical protein